MKPTITEFAYNPNALLDALLRHMGLKNDAALSRLLGVAPPVLSKIRHHKLPVGAYVLIRMHEVSLLSIRDLRTLMGDYRERFEMGYLENKADMTTATHQSHND